MELQILGLFTLFLVNIVAGSGVVQIKFVSFVNPTGKDAEGKCCDGGWDLCFSGCDHMFTVCLDELNSKNQTKKCEFGRVQTGATVNTNRIQFDDRIRDTPNPIKFSIKEELPRALVLKVKVMDKDKLFTGDHDDVDFLYAKLNPTEEEVTEGEEVPLVLETRTRLTTVVTIKCDPDYYSATCDVHCRPPAPGQHYWCDSKTGRKRCDSGWYGDSCEFQEEVCGSGRCSNGGICRIRRGKAYCQCEGNFTGLHCENHQCEEWCEPGWCTYWSDGFSCQCPDGTEREGQPCTSPTISTPNTAKPTKPVKKNG